MKTNKTCLDVKKLFNRENLKEKEKEAQRHKRQISEVCGENDYNTTREAIKDKIANLQE